MGALDTIKDWIRRRSSASAPGALFGGPNALSAYGLLGGIFPFGRPPKRGTKELMLAYKDSPWLQAIVHRTSYGVAVTPIRLYALRSRSTGKAVAHPEIARTFDHARRRKLMQQAARIEDLTEVTGHPMLDLLDQANPAMPGLIARQITQVALDLSGESFWVIERNSAGMPIEFWPIPPYWVIETPAYGRPTFRVQFGTWHGWIPETEIVWFKHPDAENPYGRGAGVGHALADEIDTDEYASKMLKAWFYNDATPAGLVAIEGARQEQLDAAKAKWEDQQIGFWKRFRLHWHSGKLTFTKIQQDMDYAKLTALREFERNACMQVYGVPPEIFGVLEHSNRSTIDSADYLMSRHVLVPRLEFNRAYYQFRIVPEFDDRLIVDYESPVMEDREFFLNVVKATPWAVSTNEIREKINLAPSERPEDDELPERPSGAPPQVDEGTAPDDPTAAPADAKPKKKPKPGADDEEPAKQIARSVVLGGDDVDHVLAELRPEYLTNETDPEFDSNLREWAAGVLNELGVQPNFAMLNPKTVDFLKDLALDRIPSMNETTRSALRDSLLEGVRAGEGIDDLADRVEGVFDEATGFRAETIARTEVVRASNWANVTAYEISGVVDAKEWLATQDDRTRDAHAEMDGQTVGIDEAFESPDGDVANAPGAFGIPEEDINCRCTVLPVVKDADAPVAEEDGAPAGTTKASGREAKWKAFDRKAQRWERAVEAALRRGFEKQRTRALATLRRIANSRT